MSELEPCPICKELIQPHARKCRYCLEYLDSNQSPSEYNAKSVESNPSSYGFVLLAVPLIGTMLIWFWVANLNLFQSPGAKMNLILVVTLAGTALVAAMEASKVGMVTDRTEGTYSPTAWFFLITIMWIVCYPVYLYKRKHFGLRNRCVAGIVVALIFSYSWLLLNSAIDEKFSELTNPFGQIQFNLESFSG